MWGTVVPEGCLGLRPLPLSPWHNPHLDGAGLQEFGLGSGTPLGWGTEEFHRPLLGWAGLGQTGPEQWGRWERWERCISLPRAPADAQGGAEPLSRCDQLPRDPGWVFAKIQHPAAACAHPCAPGAAGGCSGAAPVFCAVGSCPGTPQCRLSSEMMMLTAGSPIWCGAGCGITLSPAAARAQGGGGGCCTAPGQPCLLPSPFALFVLSLVLFFHQKRRTKPAGSSWQLPRPARCQHKSPVPSPVGRALGFGGCMGPLGTVPPCPPVRGVG